jgi:hypothetical protein
LVAAETSSRAVLADRVGDFAPVGRVTESAAHAWGRPGRPAGTVKRQEQADVRGDGIGLWIFGGVSVFVLAGVGYMRWINLSSAPRRVLFHEPEPEERPKRRKKKARKAEAEVDVAP